jgi:hypothetical protein
MRSLVWSILALWLWPSGALTKVETSRMKAEQAEMEREDAARPSSRFGKSLRAGDSEGRPFEKTAAQRPSCALPTLEERRGRKAALEAADAQSMEAQYGRPLRAGGEVATSGGGRAMSQPPGAWQGLVLHSDDQVYDPQRLKAELTELDAKMRAAVDRAAPAGAGLCDQEAESDRRMAAEWATEAAHDVARRYGKAIEAAPALVLSKSRRAAGGPTGAQPHPYPRVLWALKIGMVFCFTVALILTVTFLAQRRRERRRKEAWRHRDDDDAGA